MNKQAFSFLEMLIVFLALAILLTMANPQFFTGPKQSLIQRAFFEDLLSQIDYAKELAMVSNQNVTIRFHSGYQEVLFFIDNNEKHYDALPLPDSLRIFGDDSFIYHGNGSISNFKTVTFENIFSEKKYYLAFQLGSGKFELK